MPVALDYKSDHLVIRLVGSTLATSLRRSIVVPYSDVQDALVEPPRWPSLVKEWRIGTHFPGLVAHGTFVAWKGRPRRFLAFERATREVLTLRLRGHPDYDEVSVAVRDPAASAQEIARRASGRT